MLKHCNGGTILFLKTLQERSKLKGKNKNFNKIQVLHWQPV